MRFVLDFRDNPHLSWSCVWLLFTTVQDVQAEVTNVNLQTTSTQAVTKGSDFEVPGIGEFVNDIESFEVEDKTDDDTTTVNELQVKQVSADN